MEPQISMLIIFFFIAVFALCVDSTSRDTDSLLESSPSPPPPTPPPPPSPLSPPPPSPSLKSLPPPRQFSPQLNQNSSGHRWRSNHSQRKPRPSPPAAKRKLNTGEKVGLSFVGIVSVLQVFVVGFLVFKRRQLLKSTSLSAPGTYLPRGSGSHRLEPSIVHEEEP